MSSVLSSLKDRLQGNTHPKNSDEFIQKDGLYPFYVPTDEWDSSYDIRVYLLEMYKNKNTEDVHFDHPYIKDPIEETVFEKDKVESLEDVHFRCRR
jgi:quinol monooxygenase YgiN